MDLKRFMSDENFALDYSFIEKVIYINLDPGRIAKTILWKHWKVFKSPTIKLSALMRLRKNLDFWGVLFLMLL